jgi:hypothetical protein
MPYRPPPGAMKKIAPVPTGRLTPTYRLEDVLRYFHTVVTMRNRQRLQRKMNVSIVAFALPLGNSARPPGTEPKDATRPVQAVSNHPHLLPTNDEFAHRSFGIWERRKLVVMF